MSYILIEHDFITKVPDPPREIMYYDVEINIAVSLMEDQNLLPWQTPERIVTRKLEMSARLMGLEYDDCNKEKLLANKYLHPMEFNDTNFCFHSDKVSPVTRVECSDPYGLLAWLGIDLKDTMKMPEGLPPISIPENITT